MLQALGITDRLKEMLEKIDSSASSEYARLKRRFQKHQILLQSNQDLSCEQIQLAVDAILTDEDLDAQLAHVLGEKPSQPPSRWFKASISRLKSGAGSEQSQESASERPHLPFVADPDFLTELHARSTDEPVYKETAAKIITLASQQLCTKLKKLLKESLANAEDELSRVLRQKVQRDFANIREEARLHAEAELRNHVRSALANEREVPDNRYANLRLDHFLSALKLRAELLSLSAMLLEKGEAVLVSLVVTSNRN